MNVSKSSTLRSTSMSIHCRHRIANLAFSIALAGSALLTAGAASAQTDFNAKINAHISPHALCPDGVFVCGIATIAGFVTPAEYRLYVTSIRPPTKSCGKSTGSVDYGATATFTLPDGSMLTLDESGLACSPGESFPTGGISFGNPRTFYGNWTVQSARGEFSGITGNGTDTGLSAGGVSHFTYSAGK